MFVGAGDVVEGSDQVFGVTSAGRLASDCRCGIEGLPSFFIEFARGKNGLSTGEKRHAGSFGKKCFIGDGVALVLGVGHFIKYNRKLGVVFLKFFGV